jgi:hypothetical protein
VGSRVGQEVDGAIREEKLSTTGVQAPEVEHVTLVAHAPWLESVHAGRTRARRDSEKVAFPNAENHIGRPSEGLPNACIPPAKLEVRAGWAFAGQESLTRAVRDVTDADMRVPEKNSVLGESVLALNAKVGRQGDAQQFALRSLDLLDAWV